MLDDALPCSKGEARPAYTGLRPHVWKSRLSSTCKHVRHWSSSARQTARMPAMAYADVLGTGCIACTFASMLSRWLFWRSPTCPGMPLAPSYPYLYDEVNSYAR